MATQAHDQVDDRADVGQFEDWYTAYHQTVLAYCARRAHRTDAWDAAAEVFMVAWRRSADVPPGKDTLPWLLGVAARVLANQRRSTRRRRRLKERMSGIGIESTATPELQVVRNEEEAEVITALGRLRYRDREVIRLALWDELPREA